MVESWFIPIDILMIFCTCVAALCSSICLLIIIFDKTCHTVPMMLVGNTCLAEMMGTSILLGMAIFTFQNDIKQIEYDDSLCSFRGYIICSAGTVFNSSFLLQALYRYILVIYPNRLFYQSFKFQFFLISLTWVCSLTYNLIFLFRNEMIYDVDNQICQLIYHVSFSSIYLITGLYLIPVSLTILIYIKLVRYTKKIQQNVVVTNTFIRAKNELRMVVRLLILLTILIAICFPYTIFLLLSFFDHAPKYKFRIGYFCIDLSLVCVNIALFQFTDPLKTSVMKILQRRRRQNTVVAIIV